MDDLSLENITFNPFRSTDILLNNDNDPDTNFFDSNDFENISKYLNPNEAYEELKTANSDDFSIIHLNIRSMNKHFDDFKLFLQSLKFQFKVICLSETWAENCIMNYSRFQISDYTMIHQERNSNKQGWGVCVFIHNTLSYKKLNSYCVSTDDNETISIKILDNISKNKIISLTYRPPGGKVNQFHNYLKEFLSNKSIITKDIYIVGDFNLNFIDYENNKKIKDFVNLLFEKGLIPVINKPTRVSLKSATIIDHIITNTLFTHATQSRIIKTDVSDHFPIYLISNKTKLSAEYLEKTVITRTFNDNSIRNFKADLKEKDWTHVEDKNCPNEAYDAFLSTFETLYNQYFPIKKAKFNKKDSLSPRITKGFKKSSRKKQRLYEKYLKKRNNETLKSYKDYEKLFEIIKKRSRKIYYQDRLLNCKNDSRKTWNIIK